MYDQLPTPGSRVAARLFSVIEPLSFQEEAATCVGSVELWDELKASLDLDLARNPTTSAVLIDDAGLAFSAVYSITFEVDQEKQEVTYKGITK